MSNNIIFYNRSNTGSLNGNLTATLIKEHPHKLRSGKVYYNSKYITIGSLYVDPFLRNKGIGSILLNQLIEYAKKTNTQKIILDDMSDNFRLRNNIYLKHGFQYVNEFGPEMELII